MNVEVSNGRGRPRKDPQKLARWEPPEDWVRVVAWVSPEERQSLKKMALDSGKSVAAIIRSLARTGELESSEILTNRGNIMEKIPTLFIRNEEFKVTDEIRKDCEWVFNGEGIATEKLDGTNIRITTRKGTVVRVEKRRNPSKEQKKAGILDGWYVDTAEGNPEDKWILKAVAQTDVSDWPDGEHCSEALGPKIQGNPLNLTEHICVPFNMEVPVYKEIPLNYAEMWDFLENLESKFSPGNLVEGIVFHHPDGRRAKIKRKDFPA